ncbi:YegP family protein [Alcanivorax sp. IL2]|uniref:YegP family protein n=1 Tax=Alcanivorax sp. IL2 TaxID=3396310 RepID=UPI0039C09554
MSGYYTLFKSPKNNEWYFNLKAGNHEIILQSEGYAEKSGALNGIESVQTNGPKDERYVRKESAAGHWFVLTAPNNKIIGRSEMYPNSTVSEKGIDSVKANSPTKVIKET